MFDATVVAFEAFVTHTETCVFIAIAVVLDAVVLALLLLTCLPLVLRETDAFAGR